MPSFFRLNPLRWPLTFSFACILLYMAQWWHMPIYPDEVAARLTDARLLIDGPVRYGLFPFCPSNTKGIPFLLWPAFYFYSVLDIYTGWSLIRLLPYLYIAALAGSCLLLMRQAALQEGRSITWPALFLTSAFVGVAGSGLILSRPEHLLALHGAACLMTLWFARRPQNSTATIIAVLSFHILIVMLSVTAHLQGLLLVPVSFLSCLQLVRRPLPMILIGILFIGFSVQCFDLFHFRCSENPPLEDAIAKFNGGPTTGIQPKTTFAEIMLFNARRNAKGAMFMPSTFYLPAYTTKAYIIPQTILDAGLALLMAVYWVAVYCIGFLCFHGLWKRLFYERDTTFLRRIGSLFYDTRLLVLYAVIAIIFFYYYDTTIYFYRVVYRNLLAVILVASCAVYINKPCVKRCLRWLSILAVIVCLGSLFVTAIFFAPLFRKGFDAHALSVSLTTDWQTTDAQIHLLQQRCNIPTNAERVIMDDLTYHALRRQPHLLPITYLWFDTAIVIGSHAGETPADRLAAVRTLKPAGIIARCTDFPPPGLPYTYSEGQFCCLNLGNK